MAATTQCPNCKVVLNLPEGGEGRRLRCPKCGSKFHAQKSATPSTPSNPAMGEARPTSSVSVPPVSSPDDFDLPNAPSDLRETFDIPLMMDDDAPAVGTPGRRRTASDAAGLFKDDSGTKRPKLVSGAEARYAPRRCSCGAVVPAGMSLCNRCGLDLDTGTRLDVDDLLEEVEAPPPPPGPPLGVAIVGSMTALVSGLLGLISLYLYIDGTTSFAWGYLLLAVVCGFGVYASIRFLKGRSVKPLMITLTLGILINVLTLMILPLTLTETSLGPHDLIGQETSDGPRFDSGTDDLFPEDVPVITPVTERIDWQKFNTGLMILIACSILLFYLNTSGVRRYLDRRRSSMLR